jgi:MFS family permease
MSAGLSPPLGFLIDKVGKRVLLVILSSLLLLISHVTGAFLPGYNEGDLNCTPIYTEVAPMAILGVGFSLYAAALWPSIPYVV